MTWPGESEEEDGDDVMNHVLEEIFPLHIDELSDGQGDVETNLWSKTNDNDDKETDLTYHVVEPDVPAHSMIRILFPASSNIPEPGLAVENNETVDEHAGVEDEPPAALAELGEGGGHGGPPPVSEPSLNLEQENMKYFHPKPAQLTCI